MPPDRRIRVVSAGVDSRPSSQGATLQVRRADAPDRCRAQAAVHFWGRSVLFLVGFVKISGQQALDAFYSSSSLV